MRREDNPEEIPGENGRIPDQDNPPRKEPQEPYADELPPKRKDEQEEPVKSC